MVERKSKSEKVRMQAAARGILTITELAKRVPCSRVSIYMAIERPSRFPRVYRRIQELIND